MVELAAIEIEAADQRANRAILRVGGQKGGFNLWHLGNPPIVLGVSLHANDRATAEPLARWRLGIDHARRKFQPVTGNRDHVAPAPIRTNLLCIGAQNDRRMQVFGVVEVLQQFVKRLVLLRFDIRHFDVRLGTPIAVPAIVVKNVTPKAGVGGFLIVPTDRRVDLQPTAINIIRETIGGDLPGHLGNVFGMDWENVGLTLHDQRLSRSLLMLFSIYETELVHSPQYILLPQTRTLRVNNRIEGRRRFRQTCQHCRFRDIQFLERLTKVDLGRCAKAISALSEENLVDVELENLILGKVLFNLERQQGFIKLANVGLFRRKEEVLCHLLRDGGRSLAPTTTNEVAQRCARDALRIHAPMLVEAFVFRRQNCLFHHFWNIHKTDDLAPLFAKLPNHLTVGRKNPKRYLRPVVRQNLQRRQIRICERQDDDDHRHCDYEDTNDQQNRIENPARKVRQRGIRK